MMPTTLPLTRLGLRQLWAPLGLLLAAILIDGAAVLTHFGVSSISADTLAGPLGLKLGMGFVSFVGGFYWLTRDWKPGGAKPTDYIIPWVITAAVIIYALLYSRTQSGAIHAVHIYIMAVPFLAALTLLTRLFAPTDLCSASNAIGFTAGGAAAALYALHCPLTDAPTIMLTYAVAIAATALTSRAVLCHFIRW